MKYIIEVKTDLDTYKENIDYIPEISILKESLNKIESIQSEIREDKFSIKSEITEKDTLDALYFLTRERLLDKINNVSSNIEFSLNSLTNGEQSLIYKIFSNMSIPEDSFITLKTNKSIESFSSGYINFILYFIFHNKQS